MIVDLCIFLFNSVDFCNMCFEALLLGEHTPNLFYICSMNWCFYHSEISFFCFPNSLSQSLLYWITKSYLSYPFIRKVYLFLSCYFQPIKVFLKDNICWGLAYFFKSPFWLSPLSFNDGLLPFCSFFFLSIFLPHYSFLIFCIIFCCLLLDYLDILSIGLLDITLCHAFSGYSKDYNRDE